MRAAFGEALAAAGLDLVAFTRLDALPAFGAVGRPDALVAVIGNTRALWAAFMAEPRRLVEADPLDAFVHRAVEAAVAATGWGAEIRYAEDPRVPIQALAEAAGLAWRAPSHLSVHAIYGPWIALRAVVIFDAPGPAVAPAACARPCEACPEACAPALTVALDTAPPADMREIAARWRDWVAVRDACPLGRSWRYTEPQIRYHYTRDRGALCGP